MLRTTTGSLNAFDRCSLPFQRRRPSLRRLYVRRTPEPTSTHLAALLEQFAQTPPRPLTLSTLFSFGRPLSPESLLASASFALSEIPRRFVRRVYALENLPFIVGTNPFVARTLQICRNSFLQLATHPPVNTLEENVKFAAVLENLVQAHANDIPTMAKGFQECTKYISPAEVDTFLDEAIRNRIAVRLIAEQHVAISRALGKHTGDLQEGVLDAHCLPADMIRQCGIFVSSMCEATLGSSPEIIIDGHPDATFTYIPVHLEYILTELLKNSFRATVEKHHRDHGSFTNRALPPVQITLSPPPHHPNSQDSTKYFSIRIRDEGGGVSPANISRVFSYAFTTAASNQDEHAVETGGGPYAAQHVGGSASVGMSEDGGPGEGNLFGEITGRGLQVGVGTIAGLGYGLPMSRLYAKYFGGSLDLFSLDELGADVFLKLRCLDKAQDVEL